MLPLPAPAVPNAVQGAVELRLGGLPRRSAELSGSPGCIFLVPAHPGPPCCDAYRWWTITGDRRSGADAPSMKSAQTGRAGRTRSRREARRTARTRLAPPQSARSLGARRTHRFADPPGRLPEGPEPRGRLGSTTFTDRPPDGSAACHVKPNGGVRNRHEPNASAEPAKTKYSRFPVVVPGATLCSDVGAVVLTLLSDHG